MDKTYLELSKLKNYDDRFRYLMIGGGVGIETFGRNRYLNQSLYHSKEWQHVRNQVIVRDNGCDLGVEGFPIFGKVFIHHINPITAEDILERNPIIFDPNNLITIAFDTHNAIHYADTSIIERRELIMRSPNDTCPWKR